MLDFPNSPTNGQQFSSGGSTWQWDGAKWAAASGNIVASSSLPLMDGTAAVGTHTPYSREDHVHPSDTSRLALAGGTLTGDLVLNRDPVAALGAVTKQMVDLKAP